MKQDKLKLIKNKKNMENKKHTVLKILLALLPAVVFSQNYAWMSSNANNGLAFFIIWGLMIWSVWQLTEKNHILERLFRLTEISFFLLPISAITLTITSTGSAEGARTAIGMAIGGTVMVFLSFIFGIIAGIIMHLITGKYSKKAEASEVKQPETLINKHGIILPLVGVILLAIIMGATASDKNKSATNSQAAKTENSSDIKTASMNKEPEQKRNIGEVITTDKFELTVASAEIRNKVGTEYFDSAPSEGGEYVAVQWKYKNISDKPIDSFSTPSLKLIDANNTEYDADISASGSFATEIKLDRKILSDLNPGITVNDAEVFEVSKEKFDKGTWNILIKADEKEIKIGF